ncbi:hypothetical protein SAY87_005056 [Trapa incisa]|uniref:Uncharacterized protein n=1 Tax=Trapa incisa TaxID=236973 RepID=A0AAN7JPS5_9MYRT|nr:hypothetical protein SAY87_005056 [Trapa incisa]
MAVPEALLKYSLHLLYAMGLSSALLSLFLLAPSFLTLLAYFWPLFLSTALFLVAVVVFGRTSPPTVDKAGEGLLDYVTGDPDPSVVESIPSLNAHEHQDPHQPIENIDGADEPDPHRTSTSVHDTY